MKSSKRRTYSRDEKISILKRVFLGKEKISDVCKELDLHVNLFYKWQVELFESGLLGGTEKGSSGVSREQKKLQEKVDLLTKKLERKDSIIADITTEYVQLKKTASEIYGING